MAIRQQSLKLGAVGRATIKAGVGASLADHATAEQLWESYVGRGPLAAKDLDQGVFIEPVLLKGG